MVAKSRSCRPEVFCNRAPLVAASESPLTHVLLYAIIKNYKITICNSITSILTTQLLQKSDDIETKPG